MSKEVDELVKNRFEGDEEYCCDNHPHIETEPHQCPYQTDVGDDPDFLCTCCDDCFHQCAMDI